MEVIMNKVTETIESVEFLPFRELDPEWLELILEAKQLGITQEEIRKFLLNK